MTSYAILPPDRARLGRPPLRHLRFCDARRLQGCGRLVAGKTVRVVGDCFALRILVGIVAGRTTEPLVVRVVAAAGERSIRLKAYIVDVQHVHLNDLFSSPMAGAAKLLREFVGR